MSRAVQSPSKFTSLSKLENIRLDNYVGANGVDYSSEEIDLMIMEKKVIKAEQYYFDMVAQEFSQAAQEELEATMLQNDDIIMLQNEIVLMVSHGSSDSFDVHIIAHKFLFPYDSCCKIFAGNFNLKSQALSYCLEIFKNGLESNSNN